MWAIFITVIIIIISLSVLAFIYDINCFIFIIVFTFYLFILNILENNKKIKLTIFENILLFIVVFQTVVLVITLIFNILSYFYLDLGPLYVLEDHNNNNIKDTNTNRNIYFSNDSWSSTIRSLFIYGSAGIAIHVTRASGSGFKKVGTGIGAFVADSVGKIVENTINDPSYVRAHFTNWKMMWEKDSTGHQISDTVKVDISGDSQFTNQILGEMSKASGSSETSSFLPSASGLDNVYEQLSSLCNDLLLPIIEALKPQPVNYPIELLMDQHHILSVSLFILTIISFVFFIIFLYNIILILYKDKILNLFNNKYILMYLNLQFKIINLENIILIIFLIHNFYYLLIGLHFLAIFPIDINMNN